MTVVNTPGGAVGTVSAPISEQALVQGFDALAVIDHGANEELQRGVGAVNGLFRSMKETIQAQDTAIKAQSSELVQLRAQVQASERLHTAEVAALTQRMDTALKDLTARITSLESKVQTNATFFSSAQRALTTLEGTVSSLSQSFQRQITLLRGDLDYFGGQWQSFREPGPPR